MSREHKRSMLAFVVIAVTCGVLLLNAARSNALELFRGQLPIVAAARALQLLPGADLSLADPVPLVVAIDEPAGPTPSSASRTWPRPTTAGSARSGSGRPGPGRSGAGRSGQPEPTARRGADQSHRQHSGSAHHSGASPSGDRPGGRSRDHEGGRRSGERGGEAYGADHATHSGRDGERSSSGHHGPRHQWAAGPGAHPGRDHAGHDRDRSHHGSRHGEGHRAGSRHGEGHRGGSRHHGRH